MTTFISLIRLQNTPSPFLLLLSSILHHSPTNLLNPTTHTQIQKLIPNLNLKPPHNIRVHLRLQHNLRARRKLTLHRLLHRSLLTLIERIRRDDGRLHLPTLGLHLHNVRINNTSNGVKTGIARKGGHEVHGHRGGLSLQQFLHLLGLEIPADEWILQEGGEGLGFFGGGLDGEEFGLDLFEGFGFGGGDVGGVGVTGVEAVEVEGGAVGFFGGHCTPDGGGGCRAEEGDVG
mmetsp:Transcript_40559/g.73102  ORF Transcript_40559/g.73102 Transcript_40559/m.73102 type:complete len:232 (+) Transcript_40559:246-941(+)